MADTNIIGSLFGVSPELLQIQQDQRAFNQGMQAGSNPLGGVLGNVGMFSSRAGAGLRGALGVQSPEEQMNAVRQQASTQFNTATPEGLLEYAQFLNQQGDAAGAQQAVIRAQAMAKDRQAIATSRAQEVKALRETSPETVRLQQARDDLEARFGPTDRRVVELNRILEGKSRAGQTTINMQGETEASKTIGKGVGEKVLATAASGEAARDNLFKINDTLTELRTNKAFTGAFADLQTNLSKVQAKFAADKEAGKRVTDTEYLDALLGSDVFPMISSLGIGAKGLDTPAEREFLRKVMTGTVALERDTLIKLTETRKNIAERAVKKYNEQVDSGELNEYFKIKGVQPRKIEVPKSDDTAALGSDYEEYAKYWVARGRTPKTREQYIQDKRNLQGGKP